MKQITIFLILSVTLLSLLVCCEDKPNNPPPREDPRYYYPLHEGYGWRYFNKGRSTPADTIDLLIVGTNRRHGNLGFDLVRVGSHDTVFIYEKANTLFEESAGQLKILVGPIRAGASWEDYYYEYRIEGFENVTLTINGATYKHCVKIVKRPHDPIPPRPDRVYEWWVPQIGEVKEIWVDKDSVNLYTKELLYFIRTGVFP